MKRKIIIAVVIILLVAGFFGYRMYKEETPDIVNKKPDVKTNVTNLVAAFEKDTASAIKMYLDKIVEVTGTVKSIDTSGSIILGDEGTSEVIAGLDRRHLKDYEKIKVGSIAIIQGVCSGYSKSDGDDLLASLGATVELRSAGVKNQK